jgi:hypothetical protein
MGVYQSGYSDWEAFDALPAEVRAAHNVIWTGYVFNLQKLTQEDARAVLALDAGKNMLAVEDISPHSDGHI